MSADLRGTQGPPYAKVEVIRLRRQSSLRTVAAECPSDPAEGPSGRPLGAYMRRNMVEQNSGFTFALWSASHNTQRQPA